MQPNHAANWFVLTLSAEQAARDQDFEHFDALIRRREELLGEWEQKGLTFSLQEQAKIDEAEQRLSSAMTTARNQTGTELREVTRRKSGSNKYRTAS